MPSTTSEVEQLLDRAVDLLISPSLANLKGVEELLRQAVVKMPDLASDSIRHRVRLCGQLVENAERSRPGSETSMMYGQQGSVGSRPTARLQLEG